uniref:3-dehydroquinate synthase n=1 Tax=uncultured prokaryote TaxID=198431 RepID=A0A0H5Q7Z8_9ZZZZ|nr:hypothetical protein [uncultured prokaryote]
MKIALVGYGKMGHMIERIAKNRGHEIVAIVDIDNPDVFDSRQFASADVAIEFTAPTQAIENYRRAWAVGLPVVSGTTGWTEFMPQIKEEIKAGGHTLFWSSNFSIGVNILFAINRKLASIMSAYPQYAGYITEIHHTAKKDALVNIPTTLLGAVDASSGGKTGVNYQGLKNEIGVFSAPVAVYINPQYFKTLDFANRASGYAEMVKHALVSDSILFDQTLAFDLEVFDMQRLSSLLSQNIIVKQNFTTLDPFEVGRRKALNLGHTFGHAFETLSYRMQKPLLHGYAVMWGLLAEIYLSVVKLKLDKEILSKLLFFAKQYYGVFPFSCNDYDTILELMSHDKKNDHGHINFTFLAGIGDTRINQTVTKEKIFEALDFIREN